MDPFKKLVLSSFQESKILEELISPMKTHEFFSDVFQKNVATWSQEPTQLSKLFAYNSFIDVIKKCTKPEQMKFFQAVDENHSQELNHSGIQQIMRNSSGDWDTERCEDFFRGGGSVLFFALEDLDERIQVIRECFKKIFNCDIFVNAFATPRGAQSVHRHYDPYDVFAFQMSGSKTWRFYKPLKGMEMYSTCQPLIDVRENQDLVLEREVRLLPGDVMYFPRGFIHEARTTEQDSDSLHFTLTLVYDTWNGYFSKIVLESLNAIHSCEDFRNFFPHLLSGSNDFKVAEQIVYQKFIDELKSRLISLP